MKTCRRMEVYLHGFFILALDGGKWSVLCPWLLYLLGKSPHYPLDRGLGKPLSWSRLSGEEKKIPSFSLVGTDPGCTACSPVSTLIWLPQHLMTTHTFNKIPDITSNSYRNKGLHNLYTSPKKGDQILNKMGRACSAQDRWEMHTQ